MESGTGLGGLFADRMRWGELVPDVAVLTLVLPAVMRAVAEGGYVLDGFPRSVRQVELTRELAAMEGGDA